jgi:hypothetical protein
MIKRSFFLIIMIVAFGLPYLLTSSSEWWNALTSHRGGEEDAKTAALAAGGHTGKGARGGVKDGTTKPLPPEGYDTRDLADVIRFDGTPAWVVARWPRVTAGLAELDLQGYRVPLVTGTHDDDLAGSLTYYFDKDQKVAFISFHGTTGDPRKIVMLVTSRFNMTPQACNDPGLALYQIKWHGKPQSELRIRPARVVRADQPRARYEVDLAMKRP